MLAVGSNFFYTVTLPCTLWFLDRGKVKTARKDKILFIDARHIYEQVDRAHREFSDTQSEGSELEARIAENVAQLLNC